jgi:ankyrin repeat protein
MRLTPKSLTAVAGLGLLVILGVMAIADVGELKLAGDPADLYYPDDRVKALVRAAAEGEVAAMEAAVAAGADVNYAGLEGFRPLYWTMHAGNKVGFRAMLEFGADPLLTTG